MEARKDITAKIKANNKKIENLEKENLELLRKSYLLCDKKQWFEEKTETIGKGKSKRQELQGRIYWNQIFVDQSHGSKHIIQRSRLVMVNGEWI